MIRQNSNHSLKTQSKNQFPVKSPEEHLLGVVRLGAVCVCVCERERERERERESSTRSLEENSYICSCLLSVEGVSCKQEFQEKSPEEHLLGVVRLREFRERAQGWVFIRQRRANG